MIIAQGNMLADHHLDITKAVNNFLGHFENLSHLPFITDAEMDRIFGDEVKSALAEMELYKQREELCVKCISRCCQLVSCELYCAELSRCPVYSLRPVLCRLHFCHKFALVYPWLVKEVGDIYLESLLAAERRGSKKVYLFDCPPLGKLAPGQVTAIASRISAFRQGHLDEASALRLIEIEVLST